MRLAVICPLCGMWVHPKRFNVLRWPLRLFRTVMGGRYPKSKRGIVKHAEMEVPDELKQQLIWRLEELAANLGYDLVRKRYAENRLFSVVADHVRYTEIPFEGVKMTAFEGVRD